MASQSESEPIKHRRYEASMSRRTRKPQVVEEASLNEGDHLHKNKNGIHYSALSPLDQEVGKDSNVINHLALSSPDQDCVMQKVGNSVHPSSLNFMDQDGVTGVLQNDENDIHRASLKELMNEKKGQEKPTGQKGKNDKVSSSSANRARVEESGSLALVKKQEKKLGAAKMGRMVSRCVKVLTHLVKAKRDSKKNSVVVPQLKR